MEKQLKCICVSLCSCVSIDHINAQMAISKMHLLNGNTLLIQWKYIFLKNSFCAQYQVFFFGGIQISVYHKTDGNTFFPSHDLWSTIGCCYWWKQQRRQQEVVGKLWPGFLSTDSLHLLFNGSILHSYLIAKLSFCDKFIMETTPRIFLPV